MKHLRAFRRSIGMIMMALMLTWQVAQPLQAATFYWDADANAIGNSSSSGLGTGGAGTWDSSLLTWWDGTSGSDQAWNNAGNDTAIFWGPAGGAVTLDAGGITAGALQFKTSGYTLSGGPLTLGGTTPGIRVNLGATAAINSVISGSTGLTKTGGGTVRLTNSANSYTGTTTINDGTLSISNAAALGTDTSAIVINGSATRGFGGGSLVLEGGYSSGVLLTRAVSLQGLGPINASSPALNSIGTNTITGVVSNGTALVSTTVNSVSGRLALSDVIVGGTAGTTLMNFGTANAGGVGSYVITGALSGSGTLLKVGVGTLILTPSNATSFSGTVKISAGTVRVSSGAAFGTNTGTTSNSAIDLIGDTGILEVRSDNFTTARNVYQRSGGSSTIFVDHAVGSTSINGTAAFGALSYDGTENTKFEGRNGFGITFSAAPVQTGDGNTTLTTNLSGLMTITGDLWTNTSNDASHSLTIAGTGNTLVNGSLVASATSFDHTLVKSGAGTLTILGTLGTLDGAITLNAGVLAITDFRSINLASTSAINLAGGALNFITSNSTAAQLTSGTARAIALTGTTAGGTINANQTDSDPVVFNSTAAIASGAGSKTLTLGGTSSSNNEIKGIIQDNSGTNLTSLTKADAGTWLLSGANTYTGATTITGGVLKLQSNAATTSTIMANASAVVFDVNAATLGAAGTLQLIGFTTNNATTESFGALTATAGAGTIMATLGSGGAAALANFNFASLGTVANGTGINFVTGTANANGTVTIGSTGTSSATTLPGSGHFYINGSDFARASGNVMVAPNYGSDAGFTAINTITPATHTAINTTTTTTAGATLTLSSVKIMGNTSAFTLASGQTLTISTGGILTTGATGASITGGAGITTGGAGDIVIRVDGANDKLTLSTPITATTSGGLTKNGAGTLVINATNAQTGGLTINEGTVQLQSGTIGANAGGATTATLNIRQDAFLDLNGITMSGTPIAQFNGAGTIRNTAATTATITVGSSNGTGTFSGTIDQTSGVINITKTGTGAQTWSGVNSTYTGVTTIGSTGIVSVAALANLGSPSSIGKGNSAGANQAAIDASNAASLVFNGTTGGIAYTGTTSVNIDRLFTMSGGGQISNNSSNNSTLIFNKTNAIVFGTTASQTLTLGGSSTGDNQLNLKLTNPTSGTLGLSKIGAGLWILGNSASDNTGTTQIGLTTTAGGVLQAIDGSSLSNGSYLLIGGTTGGGIFQSSGNFTRNIGTSAAANTVSFNSTLTTGAVGFAASDSKLTVSLGGLATPTALTWGSGGFMGVSGTSTGAFVLNSVYSLAEIEIRNAINLNGVSRTITVNDNANTQTDFATITGVISNASATAAGIIKTGAGVLQLFGANMYDGTTSVTAGTLVVTSLGNSATPGVASSVGTSTGANLATQAITLGNGTTTSGDLQYIGSGETSNRMIRFNTTTGAARIYADGTGALVLTNVLNDMTAGAKTLNLRGASTQGNTITSGLTDNGGALGVTADGGGVWILSGNNTYTGITDVTAGALGAGNDNAFGTGILRVRNGSLFAAGADRTLANPITINTTTSGGTSTFIGDYSLNLTGNWTMTNTTASHTITNSIAAGKNLTISGDMAFNAITATRTLTLNGTGDTIINSSITTSTAFALNLTYSGTGSLTLGGTANVWNANTLTVSSGTLRLGNDNVIPDGASAGSVVLNPAAGVNAVFDLNGKTETINGFTANSAGNITIDNTSSGTASLTFGANNGAVLFGGGGGTYAISNTGGGALSLTKTGSSSLTIPSTGVTLSYTGATTVTGGTMTVAAVLNGTTALSSTGTGSSLNLLGGLTTPGAITSVTVGGGSFLRLVDGAGTPLSNLTSLNLGAGSGIATLSLELGTLSDTLTVSSPAVVANTIQLNLSGISGLLDATDYSLLVAPSGLSAGTYLLGSQPGGFSSGVLTVTDTLVKYTTGTAIVGNLVWNNTQLTGSWATNNAGATNFTTDLAGTTDGTFTPGPGTTVIFGTTALTGGPAFSTTLDANFTVAGLQFTANPSGVTSWSINAGTPSTSNLTIKGSGIDVGSNAGAVTINANVILGAAQSWNVNGGGANGSSLTIASIISGNGFALSKTGAGVLNLSAINTFNGGLAIKAGTVIGTVTASAFGPGTITLGDTSGSSSATLQVNTTGLTYANAIALAAGGTGTLTIGTPVNAAAVAATFSGGVTGTNNLTINNQSLSGTTTFSVNALNNAGTVTNISSSTGTVTISGGIGSNVKQIIENSTTSALTISTTALTVNSVATTLTNAAGTKVLTLSAGTTGTGNLILNNNSTLAAGITLSTTSLNHTGTITNSGTGTGDSTISTVIGVNVTGVIQNSATSQLILSGANTFTGGITVKAGILRLSTVGNSGGGSGNTITLGNTSGSAAATLQFQSSVTYDALPITVAAGSTGTLTISGSTTTGAPVVTGAITLNNNLTVGNTIAGVTSGTLTLQGGMTGTGNLTIASVSGSTGTVTFSTNSVNIAGTITNASAGTGATIFSSSIGSSVTRVTQNSATSALTLSAANAFTGAVNLTLGTLNINNANALGATGAGGLLTISGGTVLNNSLAATPLTNLANNAIKIDGDFTFTGTSSLNLGTGAVNLGTAAGTTRTITTTASTLTLGGVISNGTTASALIKAGAGTLALTGASTFTGGITVNAGILQFTTVSNNGGAASSLGQGTDGITINGGTLGFIGGTSQATNRAVTLTGTTNTLSADGTGGATITYSGAFTATTATDLTLVLTGSGDGFITGTSFVPTLGTGDLTKTGTGTWTISGTGTKISEDDVLVNAGTLTLTGAAKALDDDVVVDGVGTVLNLNTTGVLVGNSTSSAGLYARNGAVININADDPYSTSTGLDYILLGDNLGTGTLNTNAFNITTPRLDLGQDSTGFIGSIIGSGSVTVGTSINLFQGSLASGVRLLGAGNLYKLGGGTVTIFGSLTGLAGTAGPEIHSGVLNLDYTTTNAAKFLPTTTLSMSGGTLLLGGNASADTFETVAGISLTAGSSGGTYPTLTGGSSSITLAPGGSQKIALSLGSITHAVGGSTIRFNLPTGAQNATNGFLTTQPNTNGILGGYATVSDSSGTNFATNSGGNIIAVVPTAQDAVTSWITAQNITDSAGFTGTLVTNTNITSLRFNAAGPSTVTINAGVVLNLSSGGILQTSNVTGGVSTIAGGRLTSGASNELIFNVDSATQRLDVTSQITGSSLVTKGGAGTLRLNSASNFYTGTTSVLGGTLQVSGGGAIGDNSTLVVGGGQTSTLELLSNETVGSLSVGGENGSTAGAGVVSSIKLNGNTLVFNQSTAITMAGVLFTSTSAGTLVKSGGATWTNQASNPNFLGTFRVDQGLAIFSGNFTQLSAAAAVILNGAGSSLRLDQDQTSAVNRIANAATITLNNTAGVAASALGLYLRRNGGSTAGTETVGQLILGAGHNTIASDATASATSISTLTFSNATPLVRNNLATLFVVGRALGDTNVAQRGNITFSVDPGGSVGGGGGAASSTISIYPYVVGESTLGAPDGSVNFGNSFVRYVSAAAGFKPLDLTTEYVLNQAGYDVQGAGLLTNNVRFTATTTTLASATTGINSLVLDSATGITVNGPSQSLALTSGALLSAGAGANVIAGFSGITTGANPYYVYVTNPLGTLTLTAPLTTGQALVKSGAGTLVLNSTANAFTDLYLNQGVVQASALNQLGVAGASGLNFFGGTLQFSGVFDPSSTKTLAFGTGGGTLDTNGNNITLANAAAATSIGMNGAGGLVKTGTGNLTLAAQAAYAGSTAIQNGAVILASGASDRLPTTTALILGSGSTAGILQLGNGAGASNQTVSELSLSGSAAGSNAIVGGDSAISVLTVNQNTQTTFAGSIGGAGANQNNIGITKSGIGSLTLSGATLSYVGPTSVTAGDLNITGSSGALLTTSAVNVNAGATLNLLNGVGQVINLGSGALSLGGGSGTAVLGLELGSTSAYDHIATTGTATTANLVLFNLTNLAGFGAGNYDLLSAAGGGLSGATYALGAAALGGVSLHLNASDTLVQLSVTAITGDLYWQGAVGSGWTAFNGANSNFTTDLAGTINAQGIPGTNNGVIFSASSQTNTALNTSLNANFFIRDLTFNNNLGSGPLATISIAEGSGGTLTLTPTASTAGINIQTGAAGSISISAPIILGASQTWTVTDLTAVLAVSGGITGTGDLVKAGSGILALSGTNNYAGTTTVNAGVLRANAANTFNAASAHTIGAAGTLRLNGFAQTLTSLAGAAGSIVENGAASGNVLLTVGDSTSTTFAGTIQNGAAATLSLTKVGTGALTLSGASTFTGNATVSSGVLNLTGSWTGNAASSQLVYGGSAGNTVVNVSGDMTLFGTTGGNVSGAVAVYNQTAGTVTATGNVTSAIYVAGAAGSYGYFNLTGGTYKDSNRFALAVSNNLATQATAVMYIGGTGFLDLRNSEWMLNYSHAQITVADSGVVDRSGASASFGLMMNSTTAGGVYGVLNVAGGSFLTTTQAIRFGNSTTPGAGNNNSAFINLAAGTLQVGTAMTSSLPTAGGNNAYLNFAGGTLKTSAGITNWIPTSSTTLAFTSTIFGAINNGAVAGAPSFGGGLTFDTNGFNSSFNTPFNAAAGVGVTQANMVVTGGTGYIGAPEVVFSSAGVIAGGTPASGYALISGGAVVGIVITSPGTYTSGTTPTVTLTGGGGTGASVTVGALSTANTSGGLTKIGAGTLTLSAANTYTGGTFVNEGSLALGAANVLADAGNVSVNGGTFDVVTFNDTVAKVTLQSGAITGTTGVLTATSAYELQSGTASAILAGSVGVNKTTSGTVTLSGANTYSGVVNVTAGTLAFSAGNNLGNAASGNTVTVNGGTLSYTAAASLDLGANRVLTVGASGATLNVSNSVGVLNFSAGVNAASSGSLTKTGAGSLVLGGTTNLNGGAVSVVNGTLRAGFGTSGISDLTIGATGVMNFSNGSAQALAGLAGLTLNGGARLGFELDNLSSDSLATLNAATASGTITLDFFATGSGVSATTYNLISAASGLSGATYVLGAGISGWNLVINSSDTLVSITATPFVPVYWRGGQNSSWNTLGAASANWTTDAAGLVDATQTPQSNNTVIFSAAAAPFSSGTQITTTLDAAFTIDSLVFDSAPSGVTAVTINPGTGGTLALVPVSSSAGIEVKDNAGAVTIAAPVTAGAAGGSASQTWFVSNVGASLAISGATVFTDTVVKTGAGALTLSGTNSGAGGLTLNAGTLNINSTSALGTGLFTVGAGTTINNSTAGAIILAASNAQIWNGSFTFTGTQSLNLGSGAVTMVNNTTLTVDGQTLTVGGAISEGTSNRVLTKAGVGTLALGGNNTFAGGFTLLAGTLNINNAGALGTGLFTIEAGTTINNITGSSLALSTGNAQRWNGSYTFTGTSSLNLGGGNVTLGGNVTVTTTAGTLTVGGVIDDGVSTFGLTKSGAGSLSLGGSNTYGGATVLNQGALIFTAVQNLTAATNTLTLGETAGSSSTFSMNLGAASATFGGAALVQTNNSVANTITIGSGQALTLNNAVTIGYNSTSNSTTYLGVTGADGTFNIGGVGAPTNASVQIGNGLTSNISNAGILDMSGLGTFYANLGTGTFRVGSTANTVGGAVAGSTLILAVNSTIVATTITSDSPDFSTVTQAIKLGSGTNVFNATTITIGGAANRARGTLDFNSATGTIQIRNLAGTGRAAMNVQNGSSSATSTNGLFGTVDFTGHNADLLLSTLAIGGRSAGTVGSGTGVFSFDTGILDATVINLAARTGTTMTSGSVTGTLTLGGGTVTVGTVTMSTNSVNFNTATGTGDATSTLNISGTGTNAITTMTMGTLSVTNTTALSSDSSDTTATVNVSGGTTTIGTLVMGANSSAATTVSANTATSALNISGGAVTVTNNLTMGQTTLRTANTATATITLTGGSLTVGGNIVYSDGLGTENNTITLNGGLLDMTVGSIGSISALVAFNAQSGILRNLSELNGGGALTKTTSGTLTLDTANGYTGATVVSAGILAISHGGALGGTTNGTSVTAGGTLSMSGDIAVTGESLSLAAGAGGSATLNNQSGSNTWTGNLSVDTGSHASNRTVLNSDAGKLTVSGNVTLSGTQDFVLRGDGNGEISGQITGSQRLFKSSIGTGTWILSGNNSTTFTGRTSVGNGALQISSEASLGAAPGSFVSDQLTLGSSGTSGRLKTTGTTALSANRGVTVAAGGGTFDTAASTTLTVNSVITGGGSLTKEGAGTLIFTAVNTNTGVTTVNAGVLGGTGAVGGDLAVASTGTLAPGVAAGQFTVAGNLSVSPGGILLMQLGGATTNDASAVSTYLAGHGGSLAGLTIQASYENYVVNTTAHDSILVSGAAAAPVINGTLKLDALLGGYTPAYGDIFDLVDWSFSGDITGAPAFDFSSATLSAGLAWNTDLFASNGLLVVVPEPSRVLFLLLGLCGLMLRRRRSWR